MLLTPLSEQYFNGIWTLPYKVPEVVIFFEEEGVTIEEGDMICFPLKWFQNSELNNSMEELKVQMETNTSGKVSYNTAANRWNKAVSKFPSYLFSNSIVSYFSTGSGYQEDVWKACGTIKTGHTPNWKIVFNADKKKFIPERNSQVVKLVGRKGRNTGNELDNIKELKNQNSKFKSKIKALKKKVAQDKYDFNGEDNETA